MYRAISPEHSRPCVPGRNPPRSGRRSPCPEHSASANRFPPDTPRRTRARTLAGSGARFSSFPSFRLSSLPRVVPSPEATRESPLGREAPPRKAGPLFGRCANCRDFGWSSPRPHDTKRLTGRVEAARQGDGLVGAVPRVGVSIQPDPRKYEELRGLHLQLSSCPIFGKYFTDRRRH